MENLKYHNLLYILVHLTFCINGGCTFLISCIPNADTFISTCSSQQLRIRCMPTELVYTPTMPSECEFFVLCKYQTIYILMYNFQNCLKKHGSLTIIYAIYTIPQTILFSEYLAIPYTTCNYEIQEMVKLVNG